MFPVSSIFLYLSVKQSCHEIFSRSFSSKFSSLPSAISRSSLYKTVGIPIEYISSSYTREPNVRPSSPSGYFSIISFYPFPLRSLQFKELKISIFVRDNNLSAKITIIGSYAVSRYPCCQLWIRI